MYQYCLFDLDGTLTDPKEGITRCVAYALNEFGIEVESLDELEPFIGPPLKDSFMQFYDFSEEDALRAVQLYRERFAPIGILENELIPGIKTTLSKLQEYGCVLAVASSKPTEFVCRILAHFQIIDYFKVIVGSEMDGSRSTKEEVVEEALRLLGLLDKAFSKELYTQCALVGDRKYDMDGARAFGLTPVGVSYGYAQEYELEEAGAEFIADDLEELEEFLLR